MFNRLLRHFVCDNDEDNFSCKICISFSFGFFFFRFVIQCISFCVINVCTQFTTTSQRQPFSFIPFSLAKNVNNWADS